MSALALPLEHDVLRAASLVAAASQDTPAALCEIYGHDTQAAYEGPDGILAAGDYPPEDCSPERLDAHRKFLRNQCRAVSHCPRCGRVWR